MSSNILSLNKFKSLSNAIKFVWKSYKKFTYLSISNKELKSNTLVTNAESNLSDLAHFVYLLALITISSHNFLYLLSFSRISTELISISLTKNRSSLTAVSYIWISSSKGGTIFVNIDWKCDKRSILWAS